MRRFSISRHSNSASISNYAQLPAISGFLKVLIPSNMINTEKEPDRQGDARILALHWPGQPVVLASVTVCLKLLSHSQFNLKTTLDSPSL